ncbi:TPA: hypothetical protein OMS29_004258 [Klebsiella aerogenes]|nr:hypothetical protein [Klebsiella aerogenes]
MKTYRLSFSESCLLPDSAKMDAIAALLRWFDENYHTHAMHMYANSVEHTEGEICCFIEFGESGFENTLKTWLSLQLNSMGDEIDTHGEVYEFNEKDFDVSAVVNRIS